MPLMLLGLVFVIGLFAFYLISTRSGASDDEKKQDDDLKTDENVIFLPDDLEKIKERHKKK